MKTIMYLLIIYIVSGITKVVFASENEFTILGDNMMNPALITQSKRLRGTRKRLGRKRQQQQQQLDMSSSSTVTMNNLHDNPKTAKALSGCTKCLDESEILRINEMILK